VRLSFFSGLSIIRNDLEIVLGIDLRGGGEDEYRKISA
jgi:hypothetical protein